MSKMPAIFISVKTHKELDEIRKELERQFNFKISMHKTISYLIKFYKTHRKSDEI